MEEVIRISKKDSEDLKRAIELLISSDKEIALLGYSMFINSNFYKKCKFESLMNEHYFSLEKYIIYIKDWLINGNTNINSCINTLFFWIKQNNLSRAEPIKIDIQKEQIEFERLNFNIQNNSPISKDYIINQFNKSKVIQDNKNNLFLYKGVYYKLYDLYETIKSLDSWFIYLGDIDYITRALVTELSKEKITLYKSVPVKIVIEDET